MPPRGKNNPYYRTKEQLAEDVYNILLSENLSIGAKHAVIHEVTWLWTEFNGKYTGCPYWSKKSSKYLHETEQKKSKILRHDHIVPRNMIIKRLLYGHKMDSQELSNFLKKHLIGCVLLKEEDTYLNNIGYQRVMPQGWEFGEFAWERYKEASIEVFKIDWEKRKGKINGLVL
jgi:hypothetical protein